MMDVEMDLPEKKSQPVPQGPSEQEILKAEQILPMWKIIWLQFIEHKMAVVSLALIGIFICYGLTPSISHPGNW